jgi:hypothetical protein
MVSYIQSLDQQQGHYYYRAASSKIAGLNQEIAQVKRQIAHDSKTNRPADASTLGTLLSDKANAIALLGQNTAGGEPALQVIATGANATQTAPKPSEYALIALVAALLVGLRMAYVFGLPRPLRRRPGRR